MRSSQPSVPHGPSQTQPIDELIHHIKSLVIDSDNDQINPELNIKVNAEISHFLHINRSDIQQIITLIKTVTKIDRTLSIYMTSLPKSMQAALLFESPKLARQLIGNDIIECHDPIVIEEIPLRYLFLGPNTRQLDDFLVCLEHINDINFADRPKDEAAALLSTFIQSDIPQGLRFLDCTFYETTLLYTFTHDSTDCFAYLLQYWLETGQLQSQVVSKILTLAVACNAYNCVQHLLTKIDITDDDRSKLIATGVQMGDCRMVKLLCNHDMDKVTKSFFSFLFKPSSLSKLNLDSLKATFFRSTFTKLYAEKFASQLVVMLRFSKLIHVQQIVDHFFSTNTTVLNNFTVVPKVFDQLKKVYDNTIQTHFLYAPFHSQYVKTFNIIDLNRTYTNENTTKRNKKIVANNDLIYGSKRYSLAISILTTLRQNHHIQPSAPHFQNLPTSNKGGQMMAYILETVTTHSSKAANTDNSDFARLRTRCESYTKMLQRYEWGLCLMRGVYYQSQDRSLVRGSGPLAAYELKYNDLTLNVAMTVPINGIGLASAHGQQLPQVTWQRIEDLFEKIWLADFTLSHSNHDMNNNNSTSVFESHELYEDKELKVFWNNVIELIWLIGNTQPMLRGSGTVAEIVLALVQMQHGLQPLILKSEFPQLDVLDIVMPLEDYKQLFFHFFIPETVHPSLRPLDKCHNSLSQHVKHIYEQLNHPRRKSLLQHTDSFSLYKRKSPNLDDKNDVEHTVLMTPADRNAMQANIEKGHHKP